MQGGVNVKTYTVLLRYTETGIETLKKCIPGQDNIAQFCRSCGVHLVEFHWLAGPFDALVICDAPDSRALSTALGKLADCRTEACRVVSREQFREVITDRPLRHLLLRPTGRRRRTQSFQKPTGTDLPMKHAKGNEREFPTDRRA